MPASSPRYEDGPTTCVAHPAVIRQIRREIVAGRIVSQADARLAGRMGILVTDAALRAGFNDGVIYPTDIAAASLPQAASAVSPSSRAALVEAKGTLHALALLVDFVDNPGRRPRAEFDDLLFNARNPGSMASYYHDLSGGQLQVTGEVTDYIRAPNAYAAYTNGSSGMAEDFPANTPGLLHDVLTLFCANRSLGEFDANHDGFVDGVFLIHAGAGAETEPDPAKRPNMIWSHKWVLPKEFEKDGVKAYAYSTEPEDGRVGVFAHEFGHVLGLPDLYDSTYFSRGVGDWCLMGSGSWGDNPKGSNPCRLSCWCRVWQNFRERLR